MAGRSPGWPAGHIDSRLGRARQPSTRAAGSAPRMGLHIWRYLPSSRYRCGFGLALCQCASHEPASRGDQQPGDRHAVLLLDRAGWHQTGGKLRFPKNISLLHLPPYSPELNPAENIWQFLRQNHLSNRVFESYTDIVDACCAAWNALIEEPKRITSIATRDWASVSP